MGNVLSDCVKRMLELCSNLFDLSLALMHVSRGGMNVPSRSRNEGLCVL